MRSRFILVFMLLCVAGGAHAARRSYDVEYLAEFVPAEKAARVTIALTRDTGRATRLNFRMPPARYLNVTGDGAVTREGDRVLWLPPRAGGKLRYTYLIDHTRANGAYDARITKRWAILRGDDLFPNVRVRTTKEADSRARLRFKLPPGWNEFDTPYVLSRDRRDYVIVNPKRRFDRPLGWIIAGDLGTRREWMDGVHFSISAPKDEDMRRVDILSFIHVAFPEMVRAFGELPKKILIVGAGDPMWRGGLSAPRSVWLHASRPLISENGTSTLLHELTHVITRIRGYKGDDWITEGLAEFYSIELMRRSGLLSPKRYKLTLAFEQQRSASVKSLHGSDTSGRRTARSVLLFVELDKEIRRKTHDRSDIDDVTQKLMEIGKVRTEDLREITERLIGGKVETLATPLL